MNDFFNENILPYIFIKKSSDFHQKPTNTYIKVTNITKRNIIVIFNVKKESKINIKLGYLRD